MNLNSDPSHELLEFCFILGGAFLITVISFVAVLFLYVHAFSELCEHKNNYPLELFVWKFFQTFVIESHYYRIVDFGEDIFSCVVFVSMLRHAHPQLVELVCWQNFLLPFFLLSFILSA